MLLVHILFVLFSIDQSPPIHTSRVPSSDPGTCILEVDDAGNQIDVAANNVDFTHLTVPEAEAAFANANTTPPDMHRNVSSASAAPEGSVASQVSANIISGFRTILDPLQGDAEEMSKAERGAYMLTQRNLPKTQAAMIELQQKHESAETLMRASMLGAEAQKQQNVSEAMEAHVGREVGKDVSKELPSGPVAFAAAGAATNLLSSDSLVDFILRAGHLPSDVAEMSKGFKTAAQQMHADVRPADALQAQAQIKAIGTIMREFPPISYREAWGKLKKNGAKDNVDAALDRVRIEIESERDGRARARGAENKAKAILRDEWKKVVLENCLREFPQLGEDKNPSDGSPYLSWKIDTIFQRDDFPKYAEDVSNVIRHQYSERVADNPRLNPTLRDMVSQNPSLRDLVSKNPTLQNLLASRVMSLSM